MPIWNYTTAELNKIIFPANIKENGGKMRKIIFCILIYTFSANFSAIAYELELTDVIREAREAQMRKELQAKEAVKEVKNNITKETSSVEMPADKPVISSSTKEDTVK